ncbi:MAG TPA: hypothetical protein ENI64_05395 [Gammaproteobacteria bacterium]|nr:hypothetical protein [Gammaproteobacteria bacterium]
MKRIRSKQLSAKRVQAVFAGMVLSVYVLTGAVQANPQAPLHPAAPTTVDARPTYMANQVLVHFHTELASSQRQQRVTALSGARMQKAGKLSSFASVQLPSSVSVEQAIQQYSKDPSIKHVQPNYIYHSTMIPDDSQFSQQWGLQNNGQTINNPIYDSSNPGVSGRDIDAIEAWDTLSDCSAVIVAVIDTGIEYTHQDLAANMWDGSAAGFPNHGRDFVGASVIEYVTSHFNNIAPDDDPAPMGGSEHHGTHVAAIIGAVGNNALGTAGVCWQVQLMSLRALDSLGAGTTLTISDAIRFAADKGASVINLSLGFSGAFDQVLSDAVDYARNKDVLVIAAAGNSSTNMDAAGSTDKEYPCAYTQDNLLCIAAADQAFNRAFFSNYGAISVDIAAPGTNILSAWGGMFVRDNFSTWTLGGGWRQTTNCILTGTDILANPFDWCTNSLPIPTYANNLDDQAIRSFDLSTAAAATLLTKVVIDTEKGSDFFTLNTDASGGNPFDGVNDTQVIMETGSTFKRNAQTYEVAIDSCRSATCSIGVRLQTDNNDAGNEGVALAYLEIMTLRPGGNVIRLLNGTSMATPHVSGVAALVRAMNPSYSAVDTAAAIMAGGEAAANMASLTVSGKVVNAAGSLLHINPPTGISAVEVP